MVFAVTLRLGDHIIWKVEISSEPRGENPNVPSFWSWSQNWLQSQVFVAARSCPI